MRLGDVWVTPWAALCGQGAETRALAQAAEGLQPALDSPTARAAIVLPHLSCELRRVGEALVRHVSGVCATVGGVGRPSVPNPGGQPVPVAGVKLPEPNECSTP